jgi:hypothetical protein
MKELLTASRMGALLGCPRKHFWRYEVGLRRLGDGAALRFGSAWHRAMEARWSGADISAAFAAGIGDKSEIDELQIATLSGMLAGYYKAWGGEPIEIVYPEVEFRLPLAASRTFESAGKIDGLAKMNDGRLALIEHKSAGCDIAPDSDYWLRLRGNAQVMQYVLAARGLGWDVALVIYDVTRKPAISPLSAVPVLDEAGLRVVLNAEGNRVLKKDGTPRESGDKEKGYTLSTRPETLDEFADRLAADTQARRDFYFARREVPILEDDLAEFEVQRAVLARQILSCRGEARRAKRPEHGWPRNVGEMTCKYCDFSAFCLQNTAVDAEHPPAGFEVRAIHEELTQTAG